jgi:hypothetical protein
MFCRLSIQQVSLIQNVLPIQLLLVILSLLVQHVSPFLLLPVKIPIHQEFWLTILILLLSRYIPPQK